MRVLAIKSGLKSEPEQKTLGELLKFDMIE